VRLPARAVGPRGCAAARACGLSARPTDRASGGASAGSRTSAPRRARSWTPTRRAWTGTGARGRLRCRGDARKRCAADPQRKRAAAALLRALTRRVRVCSRAAQQQLLAVPQAAGGV
jgi:hypothetical protein